MSMLFYLAFLLGEQKISEKDAEASMTTLQAFVFFEKYKFQTLILSLNVRKKKRYLYCDRVKDKKLLLLYVNVTQKRVFFWLEGFSS